MTTKTFESFFMKKNNDTNESKRLDEKSDIFGVIKNLSPLTHAKDYKLALIELKKFIMRSLLKGKKSTLPHSVYFYAHTIGKRYSDSVDPRLLAKMFLKWYNEEYPNDDYKLNESLDLDDKVVTWIKDFQKSDAPQFKGKTKEERRKMAIAAYMSKKETMNEDVIIESVLNELRMNQNEWSVDKSFFVDDSIAIAEEAIESIWEETLFHLFDEGHEDVDALVESILHERDQMLFEERRKDIPKDSKVVFGRVISTKTNKMIGRIVKDKFVPSTEDDEENSSEKKKNSKKDDSEDEKDEIDQAPAHVKNVFKRIKKEIEEISSELGESKESISKALSEKSVQGALKHTGYSIKKAGVAVHRTVGLINTSLAQGFKEMEKAGVKKLRAGTEKIDEFFDRHPFIKKVSGPLVAGALLYQWNNMSFSGHFHSDFDVTQMLEAIHGKFSLTDIIATPEGAKGMTQLIFGLATGKALGSSITFPWKLGMTAALVYTGAKKAHDKKLADKAWKKLQELIPKEKEPVKEDYSSYKSIIVDESSTVPNQKEIDKKIKYLLTISDISEDLLDAINEGNRKMIEHLLKKEITNDALRKQIQDFIVNEMERV